MMAQPHVFLLGMSDQVCGVCLMWAVANTSSSDHVGEIETYDVLGYYEDILWHHCEMAPHVSRKYSVNMATHPKVFVMLVR